MQNYGSLEYSGGGGTPGPGSIPLTSLAPQAANTVVANNTGGAASPTAVPYASMPWVLKAGDTMTGRLGISTTGSGTGGVVAFNTTDSFALKVSLLDNGVARGFIGATASQAFGAYTTSGTNILDSNNTTGALTAPLGGIVSGAPTGGAQGTGTVNATALYENGTALTAKYAQLGVVNTYTQLNTFNAGIVVNGAAGGPGGIGNSSNYGRWFTSTLASPTAAQFAFFNSIGSVTYMEIGPSGGVLSGAATGGAQGQGTFNGTSYYANGNLAIDTNALLRARVFTIGTLPSAVGADGAKAQVNDSLAAPAFAATLTAGGSVHAPVYSDNAVWRYG